MAVESASMQGEAALDAPPNKKTTTPVPALNDKLRIKRLQELLETISQQLGSSSGHSPIPNNLNHQAHPEEEEEAKTLECPISSPNTTIHTTPPATTSPPLLNLLSSALTKTTTLFAITPPRSPRAENQLSYNLTVNAKYRAHMDNAPERAVELEKDLRGIVTDVEELVPLVEECKAVVAEMAGGESGDVATGGPCSVAKGMRAQAFVTSEPDEYFAKRGVVVAEGIGEDGMTLEERMGRAEIKSRSFV
ncbi:hypothetical protein Slin15195_G035710 [Septoria linicola]|uniref:Uncharacterized protein n=1 Tax=Septoria linicola TaxID=215465 RepID=A0A9Q9EHS1_9PEZI|nr:hypothetical protein Slin14017_G117070 [Septoria linicola]USW50252.1 hypothetical protein Slin15195_G035710 [Septoria linicola]